MRQWKSVRTLALAAVLGVGGAAAASAQDWRDMNHDRRDLRSDYRDIAGDYARVNRMQGDIARDRARLDEDIRCGRQGAAARDAADLARDQRALQAQQQDIRRDRRDTYFDRDDLRRDAYRQ